MFGRGIKETKRKEGGRNGERYKAEREGRQPEKRDNEW